MPTTQWPLLDHLYRRAGFGASVLERSSFERTPYSRVVDDLVNFDPASTDIDSNIGTPGFLGITARNGFLPNTVIADARQRWLFRMVHSPAPLQEKMALFWHHHFATAYSKVAGVIGASHATRAMAAKPSEDAAGVRGQIELFRQKGLGKFSELLTDVAKDPAMIVWLDGNTNVKARPQENFGRELMELFTFGIGQYTEADVYAAARVFTGWNLALEGVRDSATSKYVFSYRSNQHDTTAKTFTFPIYSNGSKVIPARSGTAGMQDGLDLMTALAFHPETARRLARRLWVWFVSEVEPPPAAWVEAIATVYLTSGTDMRQVLASVLKSGEFRNPTHHFQRYAWPAEYVVRLLREVGHVGFSANDALTPMLNMGQSLFEPPDVNGWALGAQWFSTGGMLARMNFAATLATNQRFELRNSSRPYKQTPQAVIEWAQARLSMPTVPAGVFDALVDYMATGGPWTGSETQLLNKAAGVVHLLTGSGEYQFV